MSGVKIELTSSGLVEFQKSWTTTNDDFEKPAKYNKSGSITVTASKTGYSTKTATVVIKDRTGGSTSTTKPRTTGRFEVKSEGNNCYTVTAPQDAKNWRIHVYYKDGNKKYFGSQTKITSLSKNHYNDGVRSQKVCFTKQKYNKETFRILVKWTDGAKDKALGTPKNWRPTNWYYNSILDKNIIIICVMKGENIWDLLKQQQEL